MYPIVEYRSREPWNKGKLVGQKAPLKLKEIWSIRIRLQLNNRVRDLALFNLALDSKLRACDLTKLRVSDIASGGRVTNRAVVMQQKTKTPVQFELMEQTRESVGAWISKMSLGSSNFLFPSRVTDSHLSTRQYARIYRRRACILWHPFPSANQSFSDISKNEKSSRSAASSRACKA